MRGVALEVPLRPLALVGGGQGSDAADPRIKALGDALDDAALAGGVAAFEDDDHLELVVLNPVLQLDEFALQAEQLLEVNLAVQLRGALMGLLHRPKLLQLPVVVLEFDLFVEAVLQVGVDARLEGLGIVQFGHCMSSGRVLSIKLPAVFDIGVTKQPGEDGSPDRGARRVRWVSRARRSSRSCNEYPW